MTLRDPAVLRAAAFYVPVAIVGGSVWRHPPNARRVAAGSLATLWVACVVYVTHPLAASQQWWTYHVEGGTVRGLPAELWLGWALLWGAVPALVSRNVLPVAIAVLAVDALLMTQLEPIVELGSRWWIGQSVLIALAFIPAFVIARSTLAARHVGIRATGQFALFSLTLLVSMDLLLASTGGSWADFRGGPVATQVLAQLVAIVAVPGAIAVRDLATVGHGTPFPWDPPDQLVTTGPYAYVANPMQLSAIALIVIAGVTVRSPALLALSVVAVAFSISLANRHEAAALTIRYGSTWFVYRQRVRSWWPRWYPRFEADGVLFVDVDCSECSRIGRWFAKRSRQLQIAPSTAEMRRVTYIGPDGIRSAGVSALARALEHINLAWSVAAWAMRLPGFTWFAQTIADAVGAGPRPLPHLRPCDRDPLAHDVITDEAVAGDGPPVDSVASHAHRTRVTLPD